MRGELALLQVWKEERWQDVRPPMDHQTASNHIETLLAGGNDVVDGRVNK